jgi:hypothetical protein
VCRIDWTAVSAIATAATGCVVLISLLVLGWQLREIQRATYAQSFFTAADRLQTESLRQAREAIFALSGTPYGDWTAEQKKLGEVVCHNYDVVGILVRNKMLPEEMIVDSWGDSLRRLWPILKPLVLEYRKTRSSPEFWDDFQFLSERAEAFASTRRGMPAR